MTKKQKNKNNTLSLALQAAEDKKALNIVTLDLKNYQTFTDYFLVCSGTSSRHVQAICDGIIEDLKKKDVVFKGMEGYNTANWILIDYVDFVIHIFKEEIRSFYDLERLWGDAKPLAEEK